MKPLRDFAKPAFSKKLLALTLVIMVMALSPVSSSADQPGPVTITDEMSCGVCGMYPAKFVEWQTQIIFTDGEMVPFDGGKDMFKFIHNMAAYDADHSRDDIAAIWVREFTTGSWLDGRKATYVVGSKIMGPMGRELIPFEDGESAEDFRKTNDGTIKHFSEISMADIKKLGMGGMKMKGKMPGKM
ncbi:MAG: nitrous oxide reductase accessory protein NosL [Desulfobulbaceae bacterium]|nr:nitrous oxide reductase accessory protein NosL [Desulfobulbaceae bacterium]